MTREEAKDKMLTDSVQYKNGLKTVALRKINNFIDKIFYEHEAQLKAKDKEIAKLKSAVNGLTKVVIALNSEQKARKMCATLFWEWKKHKQTLKEKRDEENNETPSMDSLAWFWIVAQSEMLFKKAYAMLKENR